MIQQLLVKEVNKIFGISSSKKKTQILNSGIFLKILKHIYCIELNNTNKVFRHKVFSKDIIQVSFYRNHCMRHLLSFVQDKTFSIFFKESSLAQACYENYASHLTIEYARHLNLMHVILIIHHTNNKLCYTQKRQASFNCIVAL